MNGQTKWVVSVTVDIGSASLNMTVNADTEDEAVAIAEQQLERGVVPDGFDELSAAVNEIGLETDGFFVNSAYVVDEEEG